MTETKRCCEQCCEYDFDGTGKCFNPNCPCHTPVSEDCENCYMFHVPLNKAWCKCDCHTPPPTETRKYYSKIDGNVFTLYDIETNKKVGWFDGTWHTPTPPSKNDGEEEKQWHDEPCPEDCPHKGTGHIHQRLTPPSSDICCEHCPPHTNIHCTCCPVGKKLNPPSSWEEKTVKMFDEFGVPLSLRRHLLEHIRTLLTEQREAMVKMVEDMRDLRTDSTIVTSHGIVYIDANDLLTKIKSK